MLSSSEIWFGNLTNLWQMADIMGLTGATGKTVSFNWLKCCEPLMQKNNSIQILSTTWIMQTHTHMHKHIK